MTNGHCLITACPGSGKTFVLRERAVRKLKEDRKACGIAVTFTKDAAKEIENRVFQAYPEAAGRLTCGTFHSLCMRQLKDAGIKVNLVNDVAKFDLIKRAWKDVVHECDGVLLADAALFIEKMKSTVHPATSDPGSCLLSAIFYRYQELLKQIGAMDFSDMLVLATQGMPSGRVPLVPGSFLLVDEAQDSDSVQMGWVYAYMEKGVEVTVVGDDDQSLYSFRFGNGFASLEAFRTKARATHISLDTTYRCAHEIILPAAKLIKLNVDRIDKHLKTENLNPGVVRRFTAKDQEEEIAQLVKTILATDTPGDWGILVRTNKLADKIEKGVAQQFPISRNKGKSFWDERIPAIFLGLVRSIWFDDLVGVDGILRLAGVTESRLSVIHRQFRSSERGSLSAYLKSGGAAADSIEGKFRSMAEAWKRLLIKERHQLACEGMGNYIYSLNLADGISDKSKPIYLQVCRNQLVAASSAVVNMRGSMANRLNTLAREQDEEAKKKRMEAARKEADLKDGKSVDDGVDEPIPTAKLMTFHGSKGLEFKNIWMFGCDEGVIPSTKGAPLEEERRLFYVGMTRAKQLLVISHSKKPSPFFAECGL